MSDPNASNYNPNATYYDPSADGCGCEYDGDSYIGDHPKDYNCAILCS